MPDVTRRSLLGAGVAGVAGVAGATGAALRPGAPALWSRPGHAGMPDVHGLHLQFGADAATEVVVSWSTPVPVSRPRVLYGTVSGGYGASAPAETGTYTDAASGNAVYLHHARLDRLRPDTGYGYAAVHDGAAASPGLFRTAPRGRAPLTFTSFGDQGTPTLGKQVTPPGATSPIWVNDNLGSPAAGDTVAGVERVAPLFHLVNGDLCYANLTPAQQPAVWRDFGVNVARSAANRPWMPALGNHEIEFGNGPHGYESYLTRFSLPSNGVPGLTGNFYSYRVGSALFLSLDADDVIYQDGGAFAGTDVVPVNGTATIPAGMSRYNRFYTGQLAAGPNGTLSAGTNRQTRWLERTLAAARADHSIDWIIVQTHQCPLSSSATGNGSDLGLRQAWLPLFDRYQVDLVVSGHDHDYERTFPVRGFDRDHGTEAKGGATVDTLRPRPVVTDPSADTFDTDTGTVYLVLGGGGTSGPTDSYGTTPAGVRQGKVITKRTTITRDPSTGTYGKSAADAVEDAVWSARPDASGHPYGIAVFDLDPGSRPGGTTTITVGYHHAPRVQVGDPPPTYSLLERFTLRRRRSD